VPLRDYCATKLADPFNMGDPQEQPLLSGVVLRESHVLTTHDEDSLTILRALSSGNPEEKLAKFFVTYEASDGQVRSTFSDADILQISSLLRHMNLDWSRVPRIYIVLRIVGQLQLINTFIDHGITDFWFPFSEESLPVVIDLSERTKFVRAQSAVLTQTSADIEEGNHRNLGRTDPLSFETKRYLGSGAYGVVDEVLSPVSQKVYARKRIRRGRGTQEGMKLFEKEIEIMKRIKHHHIVELIGSYTDPTYVALIMSPIADCNLAEFFSLVPDSIDNNSSLRSFFGCLSAALVYLHDTRIRHKDLKPTNILVKGKSVLLTDFGISYDWIDLSQSTTQNPIVAVSPIYCAPEVADHEPRNSLSDIWSLGCVFLEMVTVLKGQTVDVMRAFFECHGSKSQVFWDNPDAIWLWSAKLMSTKGPESNNIPLQWVQGMLRQDRDLRPTARMVLDMIVSCRLAADSHVPFCGRCCLGGGNYSHRRSTSTAIHGFPVAVMQDSAEKPSYEIGPWHEPFIENDFPFLGARDIQVRSTPRPDIPSLVSLFKAVKDGDTTQLRLLVQRGADLNACDPSGRTALHRAAWDGRMVIVDLLLESGAKLNVQDHSGYTALHIAAEKGHEEITSKLLKDRAAINMQTESGDTAIHLAVLNGHEAIVRLLLENGTQICNQNSKGATALHLAAASGNLAIVALLLENGAELDSRTNNGWNALHLATQDGDEEVVKFLIERKAEIHSQTKSGFTPLHIAGGEGHEEILTLLLEKGAEPNKRSVAGWTALHAAAQGGHEAVVGVLLGAGADINVKANDGRVAMHLAAERGHTAVVKLLLDKGAQLYSPTESGFTFLHLAAQEGYEAIVRLLLEKELKDVELNAQTERGATALLLAVESGHEGVMRLLLEKGATLNERNKKGMTPVLVAAQRGQESALRLLIEKGGEVNGEEENGWTALKLATVGGHEGVVRLLLRSGADPNEKIKDRKTALHAAAAKGYEGLARLLLENGMNLNACDEMGSTALHIASLFGQEAVMKLLLEKGADIEAPDKWGSTPLMLSVGCGNEMATRVLIAKGAKLRTQSLNGMTALHEAVKYGDENIVKLLLENGAQLNIQNKDGRTPLDLAIWEGHERVAELLMSDAINS